MMGKTETGIVVNIKYDLLHFLTTGENFAFCIYQDMHYFVRLNWALLKVLLSTTADNLCIYEMYQIFIETQANRGYRYLTAVSKKHVCKQN